MNKTEQIDSNIKKLQLIIDNNDYDKALVTIKDVISLYNNEIEDIKLGLEALNSYENNEFLSALNDVNGLPIDDANITHSQWMSDINRLIAKLENYKISIEERKRQTIEKQSTANINNYYNPQNNVTVSNNIEITLKQTLFNIINLEDKDLSAEDKIMLQKMLREIEELSGNNKNKTKLAEKVKNLGKWIFEKGLPVASSVLPYIMQIIQQIKG